MPLSKRIQDRNSREELRVYKIVIVALTVALLIAAAIATKIGADRAQEDYDVIYSTEAR